MLFCRTIPTKPIRFNTNSKLIKLSPPHSTLSSKSPYQQRLTNKSDQTNIPLVPILNHNNINNHYHYQ